MGTKVEAFREWYNREPTDWRWTADHVGGWRGVLLTIHGWGWRLIEPEGLLSQLRKRVSR